MSRLPDFPVDDVTLDLVEHSLNAARDEAGQMVGADMSLSQLLGFLDGSTAAERERKLALGADDHPSSVMDMSDVPSYHPNDVIRALISEVRRLRGVS